MATETLRPSLQPIPTRSLVGGRPLGEGTPCFGAVAEAQGKADGERGGLTLNVRLDGRGGVATEPAALGSDGAG